MKRWFVAATLVVGGLGLIGCGGDDDDDDAGPSGDETTEPETGDDTGDTGDDTGGEAVSYEIDSIAFTDVSAPAGGSIEVENTSGAPHTMTADDGSFDVEIGADGNATVDVPGAPGDYAFHCEIHPSMTATLTAE